MKSNQFNKINSNIRWFFRIQKMLQPQNPFSIVVQLENIEGNQPNFKLFIITKKKKSFKKQIKLFYQSACEMKVK